MSFRRLIPDTLTCCNLLCGAVAVYLATQHAFPQAFLFILFGAVFDFFDGFSARALHAPSPIGIELDSLADDITFGLAPSMMLFCYLWSGIGWWAVVALLMAPFSALRLAKFNLDTRQRTSFIGLPTPPNAIFWASICCLPSQVVENACMPWILLAISLLSCYLLISEIPFFSLKFHSVAWRESWRQYIFLIGCVVILVFAIVKPLLMDMSLLSATIAGAACVLWYVVLNLLFVWSGVAHD